MKKIINIILGVSFLGLFTVSCEVERFPYNQIEQTQAFRTLTDAQTISNGMYMQLRNRVYGLFMFSTDVQADLFNASLDFGNRNGFPHRWNGFLAGDYTLRDTWSMYYSALANINNAIENLPRIETSKPADAELLDKFIGEAHFLRAYYYHQLVIRWGKPYNAATSATDLGVPLVLTYNPMLRPARATVAAVYSQILEDISKAKSLLPDGGVANSTRITKDAVFAFESRVHLHMQNWTAAVTAANQVINSGRYPLATTVADFQKKWVNDESSEIIFMVDAIRPSELPDAAASRNNIYLGFRSADGKYIPDFIPSQWVVDLYADGDIRKNVYLQEKPLIIQGTDYPTGIKLLTKYPGNPALYEAVTNYQHKPKVVHISETWMNKIEAQFHTDPAAALATLNTFRQTRGLAALPSITGNTLRDAIREERTRELLAEGYRLNDLMRWGLGVTRTAPQSMEPIQVGADYQLLTKPAGHYQFIWGIPTRDIDTNPNIVQNPEW